MKHLLKCQTEVGCFYICQSPKGTFHPVFNLITLGTYLNVMKAVEDLVNNKFDTVLHPETEAVLDTSKLGISADPTEWKRCGIKKTE